MHLRNVRLEVLRREALGVLIGWLTLAIFTVVGVVGICYVTFVGNEQTAGLDLEMVIGILVASASVYIGGWFFKNAVVVGLSIDRLDEKTYLRNQLLSRIARPVKYSPPLPFANRMR